MTLFLYQFTFNKFWIDFELLKYFKNAGWDLKDNGDIFFTNCPWPDIKLSKSFISFSNNYNQEDFKYEIKLLGCYQIQKDFNEEGTVTLYYEKIMETSEAYIFETMSKVVKVRVIECLTTMIFMHEFVHWLMHYISPFMGKCKIDPVKIRYDSMDELEFHEGFAQIFIFWFVRKKKGIYRSIFDWISDKQPPQYKTYSKLIDNGVNSPLRAITLLSLLKLLDIQSMNKALIIAKIYPCNNWEDFEKVLFDSIKFQALLNTLNFKEKKKLFEYIVTHKPRELRIYLTSKKVEKKSVLRIIFNSVLRAGMTPIGLALEAICDTLSFIEISLNK
ncbi:hypothetical protein [Aquirufa nivalisilvae]